MTIDLYLTQEALEKEAHSDTITRFNSQLTESQQKSEESTTYYGAALMKRAIEPMAERIQAAIDAANSGESGRRMTALKFVEQLDANVVSYLTARTVLDRISKRNVLQDLAVQVGQSLEDEVRYRKFEEQKPWLFKQIMTDTTTTGKRKRQNLVAAYNRYCDEWVKWGKNNQLHVGMMLINVMMNATGFIEVGEEKSRRDKTLKRIFPTQKVIDFIAKNRDMAALLNPVHLPMVVPPADWTSPFSGGYLTHHTKPLTLIKTRNRNYLEELDGMPEQMQPVYDAVNTIQRTPWQVNDFVYVTMQLLHERGVAVGGLPVQDDLPLPPSPLAADRDSKTLSDDEKIKFKAWKKSAKKIYEENIRLRSKNLLVQRLLRIAEKFSVYEAIYFPHTLCFRGRAYPTPQYLQPQGNSMAKGLLKFADGKPLGNNEAACELAIHGANCYGYDKASMQERVDWVVENQDRIIQAGNDPMADLWWAKEADDAWSFLAFCREWVGYNENGYDHVSYIPIAKDGSCSGLQHLSAALADPVGAKATNVLPSDRPEDIYQKVADLTLEKVKADLLSSEDSELAQAWLDYGITRKTAKRTCMTRVYGSTLYSARAFVQEYVTETDAKARQADKNYVSPLHDREFEASVYLAKHVWSSINETVVAAKDGMNWLQDCARELSKENLPITWTTIDGLPVMQNYPDVTKRRIKTKFGDQLVYLTMQEEVMNKLCRRRQGNGISPNWVHANDATHLRMTVNLAASNQVTHFAMIHDSFGCHAADVQMLGACLRETFVQLYVENDPLQMFKDQAEELMNGKKLPDLPTKGKLDVSLVKDSEFFFA